jgi:peptidoglycan lytic transglycosylase
MVAFAPRFAPLMTDRIIGSGSVKVFSIRSDGSSCAGRGAIGRVAGWPTVRAGRAPRLFAVALTAMTLAACAQSPLVSENPSPLAVSRQAAPEPSRKAANVANRKTLATKSRADDKNAKHAVASADGSYGLASFYGHESQTASGEKFNARELTAAHRTLPFGTRVRVTDVATGRSVTVRVNDRGPFIPGRIVDVSASAAETLGITGRGVAKVKLDVVD